MRRDGRRSGERVESCQLQRRGRRKLWEDYSGITIMPSLYKLYTTALAERLKEEVEGKGLIPPNQTEFRKGMGTRDNIYMLNYLVN